MKIQTYSLVEVHVFLPNLLLNFVVVVLTLSSIFSQLIIHLKEISLPR